jgi:hypothetical protein
MTSRNPPAVLPHALPIPSINKLAGKRIVLASNSPRRKEILQIFVRRPAALPSGELCLLDPLLALAGSRPRSNTFDLHRGSHPFVL